jgi:hypothetical protein
MQEILYLMWAELKKKGVLNMTDDVWYNKNILKIK